MLPTLGQLITPETDVTVTEDYLLAVLDDDGSRRVVDRGTFIDTSTVERIIEVYGSNVVFWGPDNISGLYTAIGIAVRDGHYLPYPPADGIAVFPVEEAVNQVPEVSKFREHAARFAHQLDAAMGHHTLAAAEERDRLATYNTLADLIGNAWRKFQEWADIDPQELITGGQYDGTLLWKRHRRIPERPRLPVRRVRHRHLRAPVYPQCEPRPVPAHLPPGAGLRHQSRRHPLGAAIHRCGDFPAVQFLRAATG